MNSPQGPFKGPWLCVCLPTKQKCCDLVYGGGALPPRAHIHTHTRAHTHTHSHTQTNTNTHTHTHTRMPTNRERRSRESSLRVRSSTSGASWGRTSSGVRSRPHLRTCRSPPDQVSVCCLLPRIASFQLGCDRGRLHATRSNHPSSGSFQGCGKKVDCMRAWSVYAAVRLRRCMSKTRSGVHDVSVAARIHLALSHTQSMEMISKTY